MGVAVLKPEDCSKLPNPMKQQKSLRQNPNPNPKRTSRRKRSPNNSSPSRPNVGRPKAAAKNLVMGQVKILKRGEELKESKPRKPVENVDVDLAVKDLKDSKPVQPVENVDVDLSYTVRSDSDTVSVPPQTRSTETENDNKVVPPFFYAGSAFITSPPPSSVPLPAFFSKKIGVALKDDVATNVLRRILRLDL